MHISQPDDVTICKGRDAVFTGVLNITNSNTRYTDLEWYKITSTSNVELLDPYEERINFLIHTLTTRNTISSSLSITKAISGYFRPGVRIPSFLMSAMCLSLC